MKPVLEYPKAMKREAEAEQNRRHLDYVICAITNSRDEQACDMLRRVHNIAVHLCNGLTRRQQHEGGTP